MFLVIKTGFSFLQTFADFGFKKELLQTALLLDELRSLRCLNLLEQVAQFVCLCSDSFCRCLSISCCNLNIRDQANIDYVS